MQMKKWTAVWISAVFLVMLMAGCGGGEAKEVNLTDFYNSLSERYGWEENYLTDVTDELQASYYPGLSDYTLVQKVIKAPIMSSVVAEFAFLQCESEEDAAAVAEILKARVDEQAAGGAWYPESMEAWKEAQVLTEGAYVALIAYGDNTQDVADQWKNLFAG